MEDPTFTQEDLTEFDKQFEGSYNKRPIRNGELEQAYQTRTVKYVTFLNKAEDNALRTAPKQAEDNGIIIEFGTTDREDDVDIVVDDSQMKSLEAMTQEEFYQGKPHNTNPYELKGAGHKASLEDIGKLIKSRRIIGCRSCKNVYTTDHLIPSYVVDQVAEHLGFEFMQGYGICPNCNKK